MYAVIRQYNGQGASRLMDELLPLAGDIERIIGDYVAAARNAMAAGFAPHFGQVT